LWEEINEQIHKALRQHEGRVAEPTALISLIARGLPTAFPTAPAAASAATGAQNFADGGFRGNLEEWAKLALHLKLDIVLKEEG
jgi:hypothetical protein